MTLQEQIKAHALAELPKEACGFVVEVQDTLGAIPTKNISDRPVITFVIDPKEHLDAMRLYVLHGFYHSHPSDPAEPSDADKVIAERVALPSYIYSVKNDLLKIYIPNGYETPLEGRAFMLGVFDCVGLVMDYYRTQLKIQLSEFDRNLTRITKGFENLREYAAENKLVYVSPPVKSNDIIMMRIGRPQYANHCAVALEGGLMIHQLLNKRSARTVYGGSWQRNTVHLLRHEMFL